MLDPPTEIDSYLSELSSGSGRDIECGICRQDFSNVDAADAFQQHSISHLGPDARCFYKCGLCGAMISNIGNHISFAHRGETEEKIRSILEDLRGARFALLFALVKRCFPQRRWSLESEKKIEQLVRGSWCSGCPGLSYNFKFGINIEDAEAHIQDHVDAAPEYHPDEIVMHCLIDSI